MLIYDYVAMDYDGVILPHENSLIYITLYWQVATVIIRYSDNSPHYISPQWNFTSLHFTTGRTGRMRYRWDAVHDGHKIVQMQYKVDAVQVKGRAGQDRCRTGQDRCRTGQMQYMTALLCILIMTYFLNSSYKCRQPIIVKILSKEPGHLDLFSCRGRNIFNVFFNN